MTAASTALLARDTGDIVAIRKGRPVSVPDFLSQVGGLALELPRRGAVINVCEDRYHFLVGFAAALTRGLPTLLPPNPLDETVNALHREWAGSSVLIDAPGRRFDAPVILADAAPPGPAINSEIPCDAQAAVAFTSGTTGSPVAHAKTWNALVESTAINLRYYLPAGHGPCSVVSTVPAQHMYGLETSVLSAMRGPVSMHDGRPFYPVDVAAALREVPPPRVLVSTPVHLRALAASGLAFPRLARVLSATAPLDAGTAASLETLFGCEVLEIYGCTELGSMASRRTAVGTRWRFFEGFEANAHEGSALIAAAHLPAPVLLPDKLEFGVDGSFVLVGRDSDLVKVGGKRTSITEVTRLIMAIPGVADAVVFCPPEESAAVRLAAFVVSPGVDAEAVRSALRLVLDPVFIPRPILIVTALPRGATGKLSHDVVRRMFAEGAGAGAQDG